MKKSVQLRNSLDDSEEHGLHPTPPSQIIYSKSISYFPQLRTRSVSKMTTLNMKKRPDDLHKWPHSARVSKLSPRSNFQITPHHSSMYIRNFYNSSNASSPRILSPFWDSKSDLDGLDFRMVHQSHSDHVSEVQRRHIHILREEQKRKVAIVKLREARRKHIHNDSKHITERKKQAEINIKKPFWVKIILIVSFIDKCRQALRVFHSYDVYRRLLIPILRRRIKVRKIREERSAYNDLRAIDNPRPDIATLSTTGAGFFKSWRDADLYQFLSYMKPASFKIGSYMMHYGDYDRVMYVVMKGTVEVQIMKRDGSKRRNRDNAKCFPLPTPTYVGEFALLCKEPRSASIQCLTDVDCWKIERADFENVLKGLSDELLDKLEIATNERRVKNLINFFPLKMEQLRMYPFLDSLSDEVLKDVLAALTPHVNRKNHILYREGDSDAEIYFLCEGQLQMTKPSAEKRAHLAHHPENNNDTSTKSPSHRSPRYANIAKKPPSPSTINKIACLPVSTYVVSSAPDEWTATKGHALGVFETLFLHEGRDYTAKCTVNSELWSLKRSNLDSICMNFPGCLNESREMIKSQYASLLKRSQSVPHYLSNDPYLRHVLSPYGFQQLWAHATPKVATAGDILLETGKAVVELCIVTSGRLSINYSSRGGYSDASGCNDDITVDPKWLGVYSNRAIECKNLYYLFPSVVRIAKPSLHQPQPPQSPPQSGRSGQDELAQSRSVRYQIVEGNSGYVSPRVKNDASVRLESSFRGPRNTNNNSIQATGNNELSNLSNSIRGRTDTLSCISRTNNCSSIPSTIQPLSSSRRMTTSQIGPDSTAESPRDITVTVNDIGVVIGAFEVAASRPMSFRTVTCSSRVEMWTVDVKKFISSFATPSSNTTGTGSGGALPVPVPEIKASSANRHKHCIIGDLAVSDYILKADGDKAAVRQLLADPVYIKQHSGASLSSSRISA